jgi:alkanesulfonate monooxygenase SsuD/methylene tetrahydromethanopterin reductase-like flavin-dependent oxidoreductase (luciferase family)
MEFGYFTLSDNRYRDNPRTSGDLLREIVDQAVYAEELGMHSAWIGEHHFNRLGCIPSPEIALSYVAARTSRIRLAPAVVVLPLHHPLRVAEQWAAIDVLSGGRVTFATGRGFDRGEYEPFGVAFEDSSAILAEGIDIVQRAWAEDGPWSHRGDHYAFEDIAITPKPVQRPMPIVLGCFSAPTLELAAREGLDMGTTAFGARMNFGGLGPMVSAYREACAKAGRKPGHTTTSYLIHLARTDAEEREGRERCLRYFTEDALVSVPSDPARTPDNLKYFLKFSERAPKMRPEDLDDTTILLGSPDRVVESLGRVAETGLDAVVLYFSYGLKPAQMVRDQMAWFMDSVAPHFDGPHRTAAASAR